MNIDYLDNAFLLVEVMQNRLLQLEQKIWGPGLEIQYK